MLIASYGVRLTEVKEGFTFLKQRAKIRKKCNLALLIGLKGKNQHFLNNILSGSEGACGVKKKSKYVDFSL